MKRAILYSILIFAACSSAWAQAQIESIQYPEPNTFSLGYQGDFSSFTQAIEYLNNLAEIAEPGITFLVSSDAIFTENPPPITKTASSSAPVIFQKTGSGANPKILATGTAASGEAIIRLNGVQHYCFDGIDLANYGNGTQMEYGYHLVGACSYNSIKNCRITLSKSNANSKGIYAYSSAAGICHHNLYQNLQISNVAYGMHLLGGSSCYHMHESVQNCSFTNLSSYGIYSPYGSELELRENLIISAEQNTSPFTGISYGGNLSTAVLIENQILAPQIRNSFCGIYQSSGSSHIQSNYIGNVTGNNFVTGILVMRGDAVICQNKISELRSTNGFLKGIQIKPEAGNIQILGNEVSYLECVLANGNLCYAAGLELSGSDCVAANNMIHNLKHSGNINPATMGIYSLGGNIRLYYNSIRLQSEAFHPSSSSAALCMHETASNVELINNIFANYSSSGANGKTVLIWKNSPAFLGLSTQCSHNLFWLGDASPNQLFAHLADASFSSLTTYQDASAMELNSHFAEPAFVNVNDLHLDITTECLAKGNARVLAFVEVDFDGQPRDVLHPDIGADELLQESSCEVLTQEIDFAYVCCGSMPAIRSLEISNLGSEEQVWDGSCFLLEGSDAAYFELLQQELVIPALGTASLQLSFAGDFEGEKMANLIISKAGSVHNVLLKGCLTNALEMPIVANWENDLEGWIAVEAEQNSWQISDEQSYKDQAALMASAPQTGLIHLFADLVLPAEQPRLILNIWHQGVNAEDFSLCLAATNYSPQVGSWPYGLALHADLGIENQWNRIEYNIPLSYAAQTVRLIFSFDAGAQSKIILDNLRLLAGESELLPPQQLRMVLNEQAAKILWQKLEHAHEYQVEASSSPSQGFVPLQNTANSELPILLDAAKQFYRIRALD